MGIKNIGQATIRQIVGLVSSIEAASGVPFVRMEIGGPGLAACEVGVRAEIAALERGVAGYYPEIEGLPELKYEASRFVKAFLDVDVSADGCIATSGAMQGSFASFLVAGQADVKKDTILFIDPGFSVQKSQQIVIGNKYETFDIYDYRDEKLRAKLEEYLSKGNIAAIIYSSPNNPAWICLNDNELRIIAEVADKYDAIVIEDLAYLAMDFRSDKGVPFEAPYQPTVAKYTDNYILLISGSKIFSYAGQRIAVAVISDKLFGRRYDALCERYGFGEFGRVFVYQAIATFSSGVSHSAQCALAAMMRAACDGELNFVKESKEYGRRAERVRDIFVRNGFHIVYDKDFDREVAAGFFFTIGYPGFSSDGLADALMSYGISALSLATTGSVQDGLRACVSKISPEQYEVLEARLSLFNEHHRV
ncbi:MAG: pyridoxal phosphate-dependent aminotransferase [Rikenellaceae bacterium]